MTQPIPLRQARPIAARSVTTEQGYAQATAGWWQLDTEETPELQWPQSIEVFDRMRRQDAQVQSVLRAVTLPVQQTDWWLDPAGARDEVVSLVAEDLDLRVKGLEASERRPRNRDRFSWAEHLRNALLMTVFGHMFFEQVYRPPGADGFMHLRKLAPRWPRTIAKINVAQDGGLVSIEQHAAGMAAAPVLDVDRLVAYVLDREGANWLGTSLLRPAYKHWLLKDRILKVWAQSIDRNGMGLPVYTGAENETDLSNGEKIARETRSGDSAGAALPYGAKLELTGVNGSLPDSEKAVRYMDEQIGRSVLAHFLNLNAQGGSYALAAVQAGAFFGSLNSLAQTVADTANLHVVEDIVDVNWGPDERAPRIVFDPIGQNETAMVDAIKTLIDAGAIFPDPALDAFVRDLLKLPAKAPFASRTGSSE